MSISSRVVRGIAPAIVALLAAGSARAADYPTTVLATSPLAYSG